MNLPSKKIAIQPLNFGKTMIYHKCCGSNLPLAAGTSKILDDLVNKLIGQVWNKKETIGTKGQLTVAEALELVGGLKKGYGVTTGYNTPDTLAYQMMEYNIFEFSASKTEARLAAMSDLLIDKEKMGIRSFGDFEKLATQKTASFNKEWLQSEYNLSIAVGQNTAQYHRFMAEKDDFPFVEYQTAGDSKVRNQHAKLDGKIFNLSDKEAMKLWPPNGYGCRCEMLQTNKKPKVVTSGAQGQELMQEADPKWKDSQFENNRADLKQVFTNKQFYSDIKGLPEKLNEMTYDQYDLQKWDSFKQDLNPIKLDESITGDNVKELFKPEKNQTFMGFKDYFDRKMILSKDNFEKHTIGKYLNKEEKRHQLFPSITEVLTNPDEVWYYDTNNDGRKFQSRYIKFYKDMALVVDCDMNKTTLEIKTWYQLKDNEASIRKGLLIKKRKDL